MERDEMGKIQWAAGVEDEGTEEDKGMRRVFVVARRFELAASASEMLMQLEK